MIRTPARKAPAAKRFKVTTVARKKKASVPTKVYFGKQPIPKQLFNTVRYSELINLTLDVTGQGYFTICCNGLYDPNITGTGHQPLYFDQLMGLYDHYTVLKSRIKITPFSISAGYPAMVTTWIDDDSAPAISSYSTVMERPGARTTIADLARNQAPSIWMSWDAKKTFGGDPQSDPTLQGSSSANPTETSNYITFVNGTANLTGGGMALMVEVYYDVVWDEFVSMQSS